MKSEYRHLHSTQFVVLVIHCYKFSLQNRNLYQHLDHIVKEDKYYNGHVDKPFNPKKGEYYQLSYPRMNKFWILLIFGSGLEK